jgi:hypothetical protein
VQVEDGSNILAAEISKQLPRAAINSSASLVATPLATVAAVLSEVPNPLPLATRLWLVETVSANMVNVLGMIN